MGGAPDLPKLGDLGDTMERETLLLQQDLPLACARARLAMADSKGVMATLKVLLAQFGHGQADVGLSPRWPWPNPRWSRFRLAEAKVAAAQVGHGPVQGGHGQGQGVHSQDKGGHGLLVMAKPKVVTGPPNSGWPQPMLATAQPKVVTAQAHQSHIIGSSPRARPFPHS